ncbi:MAG TPA: DUF4231 domain-containing protein [Alloacidobacterium sp.]|nr:DUF4231 domain-containing protein [Alloacidobacterium sp.]
MPNPVDVPGTVAYQRIEDQIAWYGSKSRAMRKALKRIKVTEILAAAFIPFLGSLPFAWLKPHLVLITGALGVLITILEGILHLNQYQENWTNYRSTAEALKHEKFLYLSHAGPYAGAAAPDAMLAERVESLVSQEHAQWGAIQQQSAKDQNQGAAR